MNADRTVERTLAFTPRAVCARCRRPERVCYCAALPRLETRTRVVILQHPRERDMPIGTARMASLCLPGAELHVGARWDGHPALARALADPARPPILLYPGPGARDLLRAPPPGPVTLVVVDGTWSQAKGVVRDNPVLRALPRYAFVAPEPTQYRIRREPSAEVVSTIEALMHALGALEGDPERFRALLAPLGAMVDAQLACQAQAGPEERRARFRRPARPAAYFLPPAILARFEDLVCVTAESNAWPHDAPQRADDELVRWVAVRPATGERFDELVAPAGALAPGTTRHSELDESALRAGLARDELVARFAAFSRPGDVVCSWKRHGVSLWVGAGGDPPREWIDLRAVAHRLAKRKLGGLESYAASLGIDEATTAPLGRGRAGRRLALLARIVAAWRAL
jgi:DTW domain-containing protein YfiP